MEKDKLIDNLEKEKNLREKNPLLYALYLDSLGDWEGAHAIAQLKEGQANYDRLHAYLHRKEGDMVNAKYWYGRINEKMPSITLDTEWVILYYQFSDDN